MPPAPQVRSIFDSIASRYDMANIVLSAGVCLLWQRRLFALVDRGLRASGRDLAALDLCCGTGALLPGLARRFGSVKGVDFSEPMLRLAMQRLQRQGIGNAELICADALKLPFPSENFDLVTVAYGLRNMERLESGLEEIRRVLKPGGSMVALEFGQPRGRLAGPLYRLYSRICLPLLGGLITGNRDAYRYLERTSASFPCGKDLCEIVKLQGFPALESIALWGGIAYLYRAVKA